VLTWSCGGDAWVGTWLLIGDLYSARGAAPTGLYSHPACALAGQHLAGTVAKNLPGLQWRIALGLQAGGWIMRKRSCGRNPTRCPIRSAVGLTVASGRQLALRLRTRGLSLREIGLQVGRPNELVRSIARQAMLQPVYPRRQGAVELSGHTAR
jgi:hypothetical protein